MICSVVLADHDGGPNPSDGPSQLGMRHVYARSTRQRQRDRLNGAAWITSWRFSVLTCLTPQLLSRRIATAIIHIRDAGKRFAHFVRTPSTRRQSRFRFESPVGGGAEVDVRDPGRVSGCRRREWCRWARLVSDVCGAIEKIEECPGGRAGRQVRPICGVAAVHHSPEGGRSANPGL